ncbi:MAG: hypothetical protein HZA61_01745 [Candidatus Eisenbacteria bacterium]|uniref:Carboxypeptidase regulatory-like domain-containing protein n=1 Tax=Eiseniibacteriota bacterium TaxID=2212470 RepID=A0A933SD01_UNCEI|nr:hypothetical protein [Candidatus Eisenbacteria bacterium]
MRTLPRLVLAACACVFATASAADAPARGTAALEGFVAERTRDGRVQSVAFANVIVVGAKLGTLSDESGRFRLVAIPAGTWRVKVMQAGLHPLDTLLTFGEHATTRLDAVLESEPAGEPGATLRGAERPSAELRRRLARADVVRALRLARMPDASTDTSNAIAGTRIVAALTRDAAWPRRLRRAFGDEKSWSRVGSASADLSELYGLRFHDAKGWVDVVVMPRSSWVSVSEDGARSSAYSWNVNRGPLRRWFE